MALWSIDSSSMSYKELQADYWNTRGIDRNDRKDYHNAHQAYDKALNIDPKSIKCRINKAHALFDQGLTCRDKALLIKALNIICDAINLGPRYPSTWKNRTPSELKAKQEYANAIKTKSDILLALAELSEEKISVDPYVPQIRHNFAHIHFSNKPHDCNHFKCKYPISINMLPPSSILCKCAINVSKDAISEYESIADCPEENPELPGAYVSKGNALRNIGMYDDAIRAYDDATNYFKTIGRSSYDAIAWCGKADAYLSKGKTLEIEGDYDAAVKAYKEAIRACYMAIEAKPNGAEIWCRMGLILETLGCYIDAIQAYDRAIEFNPLYLNAWNNKGYVLYKQGNYNDAIKAYETAIKINPQDAIVQNNMRKAIEALARPRGWYFDSSGPNYQAYLGK